MKKNRPEDIDEPGDELLGKLVKDFPDEKLTSMLNDIRSSEYEEGGTCPICETGELVEKAPSPEDDPSGEGKWSCNCREKIEGELQSRQRANRIEDEYGDKGRETCQLHDWKTSPFILVQPASVVSRVPSKFPPKNEFGIVEVCRDCGLLRLSEKTVGVPGMEEGENTESE